MADVALVCGARGALGSAVVAALHARGDRVVGVDLGEEAGGPEGVRHERADLTDAGEVAALWARLAEAAETPRWVCNAAGGFRAGSVADSDSESVRFVSDINLATAWWSCREAARSLPAGGAIVNVAARTALAGGAGTAAYAVAKAGVVRLTEVLAAELRAKRVRVNAVLPSLIDTPQNRASMDAATLAAAVSPAAIAAVIAFLLSDAAAAVSGAAIAVDLPA